MLRNMTVNPTSHSLTAERCQEQEQQDSNALIVSSRAAIRSSRAMLKCINQPEPSTPSTSAAIPDG
jgi:hypothetical protein